MFTQAKLYLLEAFGLLLRSWMRAVALAMALYYARKGLHCNLSCIKDARNGDGGWWRWVADAAASHVLVLVGGYGSFHCLALMK